MGTRRAYRIAVLLLLLLFAADVVATHAAFTSRVPGANDFLPRWEGARSFWIDGLNPYSDEVTRRIQIRIYGRPARADEDLVEFVYPFYTVFTLWPLVGLPYAWVQAIWLTLLQFGMVAIALMSMSLLRSPRALPNDSEYRARGWRVRPLELTAVILFALLFYSSARAIILGQYAVIIAALVIGAFLALRSGRDALAGGLLAFSTIKPQMIILIIPYVLLWSIVHRRWRVVWGFGLSMAILVGLSFLMLPTWLGDFLRQLRDVPSYTELGSPVWIIVQYVLGLGNLVEAVVSGVMGLALLVVWARTIRNGDWGAFQWVSGLTLIVTKLIALRTATTNYVILYPALWLVARAIIDRAPKWGKWIVAAGGLALLVGLWVLFAVTLAGKIESPLTYLPLPFGLAFAFVAWRGALIESARRGA